MTAAMTLGLLPLKAIGMFVAFTKFISMLDPARIEAQKRQNKRVKTLYH